MIRPIVFVIASLLAAGNAAAQSESGRAAFERSCPVCHGQAGKGRLAPALVPFTRGYQELLRIVRSGGAMMIGFSSAEISDAEVSAIEEHLRTFARRVARSRTLGHRRGGPAAFGTSRGADRQLRVAAARRARTARWSGRTSAPTRATRATRRWLTSTATTSIGWRSRGDGGPKKSRCPSSGPFPATSRPRR